MSDYRLKFMFVSLLTQIWGSFTFIAIMLEHMGGMVFGMILFIYHFLLFVYVANEKQSLQNTQEVKSK